MNALSIRKSLAALTLAGAATATLFCTTSSANATSTATGTTFGNAPACVAVWQHTGRWTRTGHARNDCGYRLNIKIVWAYGGDGSCKSVAPGWEITSQVAKSPRRFDGASRC